MRQKIQSFFRYNLPLFLAVLGPGLVVMLADTDAGSVIVAAQSGVAWGYRLLSLQLIMIPIIYIAQELTVRLGLCTGLGHGELIKQKFGKRWAWVSVSTLLVCCIGAIITELSGLVGVGSLFGVSPILSVSIAASFLILIAWTGSYRRVERIALLIGAFELVFIFVAWDVHPNGEQLLAGLSNIPWHDHAFLYLAAANIGAVIMPWMIFYQQSAVIDKGLNQSHLRAARWDTAIGSIITQAIMAAVLIATAATIGTQNANADLQTVHQISDALTPSLGSTTAKILFALGMSGAAMVAAIVVSLTAAWGLGEVIGYRRSLQDHPREAPWFYSIYTLVIIAGSIVVVSGINLVQLTVAVEVMNALLLPIVLLFLFLLARFALPEPMRLKGWYAWIVGAILAVTSLFGLFAGLIGTFAGW
jgi:Mn2+/Fe2+ NRAMP family transporter